MGNVLDGVRLVGATDERRRMEEEAKAEETKQTGRGKEAARTEPRGKLKLKFDEASFSSEALAEEVEAYGATLREINLMECDKVKDKSLIDVGNKCSDLITLVVKHCFRITDLSITHIGQHCPNLTTLNVAVRRHEGGAGAFKRLLLFPCGRKRTECWHHSWQSFTSRTCQPQPLSPPTFPSTVKLQTRE